MKVSDVMRRSPLSIEPDQDLSLAKSMMAWADARHLPVVDGGKVVGLLSARELVAHEGAGIVRDHMSSPAQTAGPDDSLTEVAARMAHAKIGSLPVVERGALVGIVTTTDVLSAQVAAAFAPPLGPTVAAVMTRQPKTIAAGDYVVAALDRMREYAVRHLPVVDGDGKVIGMLSDRDVRYALGNPFRAADPEQSTRDLTALKVEALMTRGLISVRADESVANVARLFVAHRLSAVPVVGEDQKLVGIVSYIDLLRAQAPS